MDQLRIEKMTTFSMDEVVEQRKEALKKGTIWSEILQPPLAKRGRRRWHKHKSYSTNDVTIK